jgi:hypothetical protein
MEIARSPSPATVASHLSSLIKRHVRDHECSYNKCNIVNLTIEIHRQNEKYYICCKYLKAPSWVSRGTLIQTLYNIYLCKESGKIHHCHKDCDGGRITNRDNCQVCVVSGVQYESETVRSWQISSRCVPTVLSDKRDPHMYSRSADGRVKNSGIHNIKVTQCVMVCEDFIKKLLFSRKRMMAEMHKRNEYKKDSEKIVNKYRRYCERTSKPKVYMHSLTLYIHNMKRKPMFTRLIAKSREEQVEIMKKYTTEIISYWKMFIAHTVAQNSTFSFKVFVPACLYIMRNGLYMNGVDIIKKSRYLESALPEANGLHLYNINKPSLTHGQKHIVRVIRETVEKKRHTAQELKQFCVSEYNKLYK